MERVRYPLDKCSGRTKSYFARLDFRCSTTIMSDRSLQAFSYFTSSSLYGIHRTVKM